MVMSEIESKRNLAIKAEDNLKELNRLIEGLQKWLKEIESDIKNGDKVDGLKEQFHDREQVNNCVTYLPLLLVWCFL